MKNKKLTAVLVALSVALCGCNTVNDNPDIFDSTVPSIGSVYDIDSASIIENETIPEITSESSISAKTEKSEESKVNSISESKNSEESSEKNSDSSTDTASKSETSVNKEESASETKKIEKTTLSKPSVGGESAVNSPPASRTTTPAAASVSS